MRLAGTPFAVAKHGPLLLTATAALDPAVSAEIRRVLAPGGTVYLLGGTAALTPAVANAVAALGFPVVRIAGADRFATATYSCEHARATERDLRGRRHDVRRRAVGRHRGRGRERRRRAHERRDRGTGDHQLSRRATRA